MARVLYMVLAFLVLATGLAFHVRNQQLVMLDYYAGKVTLEVSVIAVGALALGVVLGVVAMLSIVLGLKRDLSRAQRRQRLLTRELESLRATTSTLATAVDREAR